MTPQSSSQEQFPSTPPKKMSDVGSVNIARMSGGIFVPSGVMAAIKRHYDENGRLTATYAVRTCVHHGSLKHGLRPASGARSPEPGARSPKPEACATMNDEDDER
jgi:hypothetical protein